MNTKKCQSCDVEKSVTEFGKYKSSRDGLQPLCKPCNSELKRGYRLEHKRNIVALNKKSISAEDELASMRELNTNLMNANIQLQMMVFSLLRGDNLATVRDQFANFTQQENDRHSVDSFIVSGNDEPAKRRCV
jgi:hypothetical protein